MNQWSPILSGEVAANAWTATHDIANAIQTLEFDRGSAESSRSHTTSAMSEALMLAYFAFATGESEWLRLAIQRLDEAITHAPEIGRYIGLYGGLCGLGWNIEHFYQATDVHASEFLERRSAEEDADSEIDRVIMAELSHSPWNGPYDLISGLAGVGIYFLECLPRERSVQGLRVLIDLLEVWAQHTDDGVTFHTPPHLIPEEQRRRFPKGYYNLGVAHGIPAIAYLLCEIQSAGIDRQRCANLLEQVVHWLLQQNAGDSSSKVWFPSWLGEPAAVTSGAQAQLRAGENSRLSWCYGDLGILGVLHHVSRRTAVGEWVTFADKLRDHCLSLVPNMIEMELPDACLCHNWAGAAHIFNRLFQSTGDIRCREASIAMFKKTLAVRQQGTGVGGYVTFRQLDSSSPGTYQNSSAFLDGASGIALAFLAGLSSVEPNWDRVLLLSGRSWC